MFRHYRQRRGPYALAEPSRTPSAITRIIVLLVALFLVYLVLKWLFGLIGFGSNQQNASVLLSAESGTVSVSVDGGLMQHAQDDMKIYAGDRLATGNDGFATLTFFDGTIVRLDEQSEATLEKSTQGDETSEFNLELTKGNAWIQTPTVNTLSGTVIRSLSVGTATYTFPADSEALVKQNVILVFSGDGNGVSVAAEGATGTFWIGEGQQWTAPEGAISGDPLRFRSAIDPLVAQSTFVMESRRNAGIATGSGTVIGTGTDILTVSAPSDNQIVSGTTVKVTGAIGTNVDRVRVNSYLASVDTVNKTFTQELAMGEDGTMAIRIEALDADSVVLQAITRTVKKGTVASSVGSPSITSPAKTGETYRTQQTEFNIQGTAPAGTSGIMVNDYRLQLFRPGDATWAYSAGISLQNLRQGENIFDVYALDAAGNKSAPARLVVIIGEGTTGVIGGNGSASSVAVVDESTLPKNAPLTPGIIAVTGPTPGTQHTATGSEFLIEGTTSKETTNVWVNGYRLQLFKSGGGYWNYIANTALGTLKRGANVYKITARNAKDEILDTFEYNVTYNP